MLAKGNEKENDQKNKPKKLMYVNIQGLVTENSRKKLDYLSEMLNEGNVIILNLTETWLNKHIKDDVKIEGYEIIRTDRETRQKGGVAIYITNRLTNIIVDQYSNDVCEMVAIEIPASKIINIVVYRPPKTTSDKFEDILKRIDNLLETKMNSHTTVILNGDFNFPFIEWEKRGCEFGCQHKFKTTSNYTNEESLQFKKLMEMCEKHFIIQNNHLHTRGNNTLDLIFTNDLQILAEIEVQDTSMSDHRMIEMVTTLEIKGQEDRNINEELKENEKGELKNKNFHNENIDWIKINKEIEETKWEEIFETKVHEESMEIFYNKVTEITNNVPQKRRNRKKRIPRDRRSLYNKKKNWEKLKKKAYSKERIDELNERIKTAEKEIIESVRKENIRDERRTIQNIERNPKVFFSYAKKFKSIKTEIGPFQDGDEYTNDPKKVCEMLLKQYNSVFSTTEKAVVEGEMFNIEGDTVLNDIPVSRKDIRDAIDEISSTSAAGPDGIQAVFFKKTRDTIDRPLAQLLRQSITESSIVKVHKLAYIAPQHKGGSRLHPKNYRPVSLTSHIIKIFERVIKKHILKHLQNNNMINKGQHGFIPGRSTQTQLLMHFETIYESMLLNERMDIVYLDFAKAFDKVDHKIILEKLVKHRIGGNIGKWIKEFLIGRKQIVIANGHRSDEAEVLSGVPQGTVLAAILFVIMIYDIDEKVKEAIIRSFADDTRVSMKIKKSEDCELLQSDLETIYKWARDNGMEFNVEKFEQITHGVNNDVTLTTYRGPNGEDITKKRIIKDLGVIINEETEFSDHIDRVVASCKVMSGYIFRTFNTREFKPMLMLYKTFIRSKVEYCNLVWAPHKQTEIAAIESIQRAFTAKIEEVQHLDYWERLEELKLYSLERRRERYMIIYAWQQLEGIKENIMKFDATRRGRGRLINSRVIPWTIPKKNRTRVHNAPARKMERLFNKLPAKMRNITGVTTETFKRKLDEFLQTVPDRPRLCDDKYISGSNTQTNSILDQINNVKYTVGATR